MAPKWKVGEASFAAIIHALLRRGADPGSDIAPEDRRAAIKESRYSAGLYYFAVQEWRGGRRPIPNPPPAANPPAPRRPDGKKWQTKEATFEKVLSAFHTLGVDPERPISEEEYEKASELSGYSVFLCYWAWIDYRDGRRPPTGAAEPDWKRQVEWVRDQLQPLLKAGETHAECLERLIEERADHRRLIHRASAAEGWYETIVEEHGAESPLARKVLKRVQATNTEVWDKVIDENEWFAAWDGLEAEWPDVP